MSKFPGLLAAISVLVFANATLASDTGRVQIAGVKSLTISDRLSSQFVSISAPQSSVELGDTLALNYMMVVNIDDYDLPRPQDGWVYFEVDDSIYRVDLYSREVLELVARRLR